MYAGGRVRCQREDHSDKALAEGVFLKSAKGHG